MFALAFAKAEADLVVVGRDEELAEFEQLRRKGTGLATDLQKTESIKSNQIDAHGSEVNTLVYDYAVDIHT